MEVDNGRRVEAGEEAMLRSLHRVLHEVTRGDSMTRGDSVPPTARGDWRCRPQSIYPRSYGPGLRLRHEVTRAAEGAATRTRTL